MKTKEFVYAAPVVEFMTVLAHTCLLLEHTEEVDRDEFIDKSLKFLPLLYLKAQLLPVEKEILDGNMQTFVTEEDYNKIRNSVEMQLGTDDKYLEVFMKDMKYSDTPISASIAEGLADIYQELKNTAALFATGEEEIMHDAIVTCRNTFIEHWGQKLLCTLRALHALWIENKQAASL